MFDKLKRHFRSAKSVSASPATAAPNGDAVRSYLAGAYRLHRREDVERFTKLAADAFPEFAARISCFGADWLGRQFATDNERVSDGEAQILLLEPGSGEAFEIPASFEEFHEHEIVQHPNEVAELALLGEWRAAGGAMPGYDQCVGYRKPIFFGGKHDSANLEMSDFEVYWTICGQLLAQTRALPKGTTIGQVRIE